MLGANRVVKSRGICRELGTVTGRESADGEEQEGSSRVERFGGYDFVDKALKGRNSRSARA